jgi:small nuclear ribonucleoprotein (snRNP)-like protein
MRQYLRRTFRVTISDGRHIRGTFECIDQHKNMILSDAQEDKPSKKATDGSGSSIPGDTSRRLGMVMVPGKHLVKCEMLE